MQCQWRWRWWAASGSHHRCRRVKTRLILWLAISPRSLCLIPTMAYTWYGLRVRDWMVGCRTFRKWRYGGRCHFGCSFSLFSSLYFFTSLDLGPVQMASAWVFTTSGDKASGGGVSPCAGSAEWLPFGTNRLWDLWVRTFAHVERLFDCFLSIPTLVQVYAAQGVCT